MSTYLQHRVVVKFPFVTSQNWSAVDIDRSTALVHNEEIPVVFKLDDPYHAEIKHTAKFNTEKWSSKGHNL